MILLEKWKKRLPAEKTPQELDAHYSRMEKLELEKGDYLAMVLGAFLAFAPLLLVLAAIILIPMLLFGAL